jgi:hypothetical protein
MWILDKHLFIDMSREVKIGENVIGEETKITLSIKTATWVIGGLLSIFITLFTIGYIDMKSEIGSTKESYKNELELNLKELRNKHEAQMKELGDIKISVGIILDRESGRRNTQNSITTTPTENRPE